MTMTAYEHAKTHEMTYTITVSREEFKAAEFTEKDLEFFRQCQKGSVSKHILGLSVLAAKIEQGEQQAAVDLQLPRSWRERVSEELDKGDPES